MSPPSPVLTPLKLLVQDHPLPHTLSPTMATHTTNGSTNGTTNGSNGDVRPTPALCASAPEFLASDYDFVIIGGGTAGLVLAARLTENEDVRVGVLEAGPSRLDDPLVDVPAAFLHMLGNPDYDWCLKTEPQVRVSFLWARGVLKGEFVKFGGIGLLMWFSQSIMIWCIMSFGARCWGEVVESIT